MRSLAATLTLSAPVVIIVVASLLFGPGGPATVAGLPDHGDIPPVAVRAYADAATAAAHDDPACRPSWALLAGIGKVETDHGRHAGAAPDARGVVRPPLLGPVLDGSLAGTRAVVDTDGGRLDGNGRWDRAVGPMQFIPQTWFAWARDGDGDGQSDPQNLFDAARTAVAYLCAAAGGTLEGHGDLRTAVRAYNRSETYVDAVLEWMVRYRAEAVHTVRTGSHLTCPVMPPVHFIDSWHFPRSGGRVHKGQDLFAPEGTPLVAVEDGTITDVRVGAGLGGNVIWLAGHSGHHWYYAHLQTFAAGLRVGDEVHRGQAVGTVGRTGNARTTPAHLHIQWRPDGRGGPDANPYDLLSAACPGHRDPR